ncbi:MAG: DUF1476 domain-containing protein [Rhodospirillum sp.]|nr:DUF1476 domain-containing protein [Rhodospirillum sp.]MCF8490639.1 DUF1476 domain-containing protein [Rhodospirillum sp.]MCF8500731.1 DUF1476 domain-containing protein [Rhodospirillum sp.]
MSDAFENRQKGFEAKYQLDEERAFRITAKRDKLFGLWAAKEMAMDDPAAEAYALALVESELTIHGDDEIIAKVLGDLTAKGVDITEGRLSIKLGKFRDEADRVVRGLDGQG